MPTKPSDFAQKRRVLGLSERVIFAGVRRDVARCYSAMDVLAFPSLYEGLPNVVIEAQANGLPCVISDAITQEVLINPNVSQMNLANGSAVWAAMIEDAENNRLSADEIRLESAGYDVNSELSHFISVVYGE